MKLFKNFFAIAAVSAAVVACNNAPEETVEATEAEEVSTPEVVEAVSYAVSEEGNSIHWVGYKTFSDDEHMGTITISEGEFSVEGDQLVGGSFIIDMNSIDNEDLAENAEYKAKLEGHLKSPDFFNVGEHPTAKFTITGIEAVEGTEGVTHNISGNLMMRGAEKNITIPAAVSMADDMITLTAPEFVIDRTNWGVEYGNSGIEGIAKENIIHNNIKLEVNVKAKRA